MANQFMQLRTFLTEVAGELKKSSWPTRKELVDSTVVVIATVMVLGLFVAAADLLFIHLVRVLTQGV